ncbi:hypothetical protein OF83DRAFT_1081103 [Amylostereum chailletii]|nr:hypothetical protein OF83DRAFT_1081103 [Amylostereum chailletii]
MPSHSSHSSPAMEWLSAGASAVQAVRIVYDTVKHHTPTSQLHQGQHHLYKGIGKIHRHMEKLPPRALSALMHKHDHLVEEEREVRMEREKPLGAIRAWGPAHEFKDHAENFTQEVSRSTHDLRATEINSYLDKSRSVEPPPRTGPSFPLELKDGIFASRYPPYISPASSTTQSTSFPGTSQQLPAVSRV